MRVVRPWLSRTLGAGLHRSAAGASPSTRGVLLPPKKMQ